MFQTTGLKVFTILILFSGIMPAQEDESKERKLIKVPFFGAQTRAPSADEVKERAIPFAIRAQGQIVVDVSKGGPADLAKIKSGDVILEFGGNKIFSRDDLVDLISVSKSKQMAKLLLIRNETNKRETVDVVLGAKKVKTDKKPQFKWQFAGLAHLQKVLDLAKSKKSLVMIGLSGAET